MKINLSQQEKAEIHFQRSRGKTPRWISKHVGRALSTVQRELYVGNKLVTNISDVMKFETHLAKQVAAAVQAHKPKPYRYRAPKVKHLLEILPFDLHILKYCWGAETVTSFDVKAAVDLFKWSIEHLLAKGQLHGVERILLVVGNDVMHVDGPQNTTSAGTPMDVDTRYFRGFMKAHEVHSWAIRRCAEVAPVDVLVVRGNHDNTSSWHLGHVLATEFANHPNVTVDNSPRLRKYYKYGVNLLGFTHGSEEKISDLPVIMPREQPQLWAETEHREWHIGHLHKYRETAFVAGDAFAGTRVRICASLTAHDAWHTKHGYMDRRCMEAFIHGEQSGYAGHFSANVGHFTGVPMKEE